MRTILNNTYQHREAWLHAAAEALQPLFVKTGYPIPDQIRVACAFPSRRAVAAKAKTIGQCWAAKASADGTVEMMVSPVVADPLSVIAILAHELVHAAVGVACGHKGPFRTVALGIGLVGPMTATSPGPDFIGAVKPILEALGPYPHAVLDPSQLKKQSTRLLKARCGCEDEETGKRCGYTVRITARWVNAAEYGAPICPKHDEPMLIEGDE